MGSGFGGDHSKTEGTAVKPLPRIPGFGQPVIYRGTRYPSYTALGAAFGRRPDDVRKRLERGLPLERRKES